MGKINLNFDMTMDWIKIKFYFFLHIELYMNFILYFYIIFQM